MPDNPLNDLLAILRAIKEDIAVVRGDLSSIRRHCAALEARLERQERASRASGGGDGS